MSAVLQFPIMARLQQDMQRMGLGDAGAAKVADLREAKVRRAREESLRRYRDLHGDDFTPPEAA